MYLFRATDALTTENRGGIVLHTRSATKRRKFCPLLSLRCVLKALSLFLSPPQQLIERPPLHPSPQVSDFLTTFARTLPLVFFKPLFVCAASDRDTAVALHLCTMLTHAHHVTDYWTRDAEMICVALLGGTRGSAPHGAARIGQLVLLVELVGAVRILRRRKEVAPAGTSGEVGWGDVVRFATALETRVWAMIEVQVRTFDSWSLVIHITDNLIRV